MSFNTPEIYTEDTFDMNNENNDLTNNIHNTMREAIMNEIKIITDRIETSMFHDPEDSLVSKLPETIFVNYFLPLFSGELDNNIDANKRLKEWFSIAGSPQGSVNIINNQGKIIFTVPGVFATDTLNSLSDNRRSSIRHFVEQSALASSVMPAMATNVATEHLPNLLNDVEKNCSSEDFFTHKEQWNSILIRYGKKPYEMITNQVENKKEDKDNTDDDLIFID